MNHYILHWPLGTGSELPAVTAVLERAADLLMLRKRS